MKSKKMTEAVNAQREVWIEEEEFELLLTRNPGTSFDLRRSRLRLGRLEKDLERVHKEIDLSEKELVLLATCKSCGEVEPGTSMSKEKEEAVNIQREVWTEEDKLELLLERESTPLFDINMSRLRLGELKEKLGRSLRKAGLSRKELVLLATCESCGM